MIRLIALVCSVVLLASCSMMGEYKALKAIAEEGVETAIQDRMDFNDTKAEVLVKLPCAASLGATFRIMDTRKRDIIIELCGGPPADSQITVDELATLMRAANGSP